MELVSLKRVQLCLGPHPNEGLILPGVFQPAHTITWSYMVSFRIPFPRMEPEGLHLKSLYIVLLSPVAKSCLTLRDPMDCSTPGLPVHHQLLELAQTHVHRVGDAIQPSHPLSSPSPPVLNLSQHQGLFQ